MSTTARSASVVRLHCTRPASRPEPASPSPDLLHRLTAIGTQNRLKEARMSPHPYRLLMTDQLAQLRRSYRVYRNSPQPAESTARTRIWSDQHAGA
jgi:hypothetical protein